MRIAVIGDIHLFRLRVSPRRLLGKRLLGQSNLWFNRRFRFNHDLLAPLIDRVRRLEPDLVLLTGDLTTTALEDEFADIEQHFLPLAEHVPVVMVPGNHDRYTFRSARKKRMEKVLHRLMPERFPDVRPLSGRWRLLALDSARPQVMLSRGGLGARQIAAARRLAGELTADDGLVVLCHYPSATPPGTPRSWAHEMAGAEVLHSLLATCPARVLFVHGHIHKPWHWEKYREGGRQLDFLNAGAPCMISAPYPLGQGFWEIELPAAMDQALTLVHHVPMPGGQYGTKPSRAMVAGLDARWHARSVL
ncbi:MAG: metallophosphoesterase [Phycisphaeraceae bacterium]